MKKVVLAGTLASVMLLSGCSGVSQESYNSLSNKNGKLQNENASLKFDNSKLESANEALEAENERISDEYKQIKSEYDQLKKEAEPYLQLSEAERAAEMERLQKEEEERKAQEEAARREEEAKGYETGITYEDISRSPDKYKGEKVKFTGRVLQLVAEGTYSNEIRMSTDGNYDDVIFISYDPGKLDVRVLEDDNITVCGKFSKMYTYTTVLGSSVTVPLVYVDIITINN